MRHEVPPYNADEIDALELLDAFARRWRWRVAGMAIGGTLGAVAGFVMPAKYEAQGIIRVAQAASMQEGGVRPALVETVPETIARMQTPAFREEVARRLVEQGILKPDNKADYVQSAGSPFKPIKDATNYINVTLAGKSPAAATAEMTTIAQVLQERQQVLVAERVQQVDRAIALAKDNLAYMEKNYSGVQSALQARSSAEAHLELARMSEAGTMATMRQKILDLENAKLPPTTRATALVEQVRVSDKPHSPKTLLMTAVGLLAGGVLGTLMGFLVPAWRVLRAQRSSVR